jgi:hypothetical protein
VLSGTVVDRHGHPVSGARVFLTETPVAMPDVAALTDAAGRFAFGAPAPGLYTVECATDDEERASAMVSVPREGAEATLRLAPG